MSDTTKQQKTTLRSIVYSEEKEKKDGRKIVVVNLKPGVFKAFYQSTGKNSHSAGTYFPFEYINREKILSAQKRIYGYINKYQATGTKFDAIKQLFDTELTATFAIKWEDDHEVQNLNWYENRTSHFLEICRFGDVDCMRTSALFDGGFWQTKLGSTLKTKYKWNLETSLSVAAPEKITSDYVNVNTWIEDLGITIPPGTDAFPTKYINDAKEQKGKPITIALIEMADKKLQPFYHKPGSTWLPFDAIVPDEESVESYQLETSKKLDEEDLLKISDSLDLIARSQEFSGFHYFCFTGLVWKELNQKHWDDYSFNNFEELMSPECLAISARFGDGFWNTKLGQSYKTANQWTAPIKVDASNTKTFSSTATKKEIEAWLNSKGVKLSIIDIADETRKFQL